MNPVTTINVHRFASGILLEMIGHDSHGEISVRSFEFEYHDGEHSKIVPRSSLPSMEALLIEDTLAEHGYELHHPNKDHALDTQHPTPAYASQ